MIMNRDNKKALELVIQDCLTFEKELATDSCVFPVSYIFAIQQRLQYILDNENEQSK